MSDFFPGFEPTRTSPSQGIIGAAQDVVASIYKGVDSVRPLPESISVTSAKTVVDGNNKEGVNQLLPKYSNQAKQVGGNHLDPWLANVVKYVQRHQRKNGKEDLEKAVHYLEYVIANYDTVIKKYYKE